MLTYRYRIYPSEHCGSKHDRDVKRSINISVEGNRLLEKMVSNGAFENQEKPRRVKYSKKKKDSALESDVNTAGLAERGEIVSWEPVPASFSEACQEKHLVT